MPFFSKREGLFIIVYGDTGTGKSVMSLSGGKRTGGLTHYFAFDEHGWPAMRYALSQGWRIRVDQLDGKPLTN